MKPPFIYYGGKTTLADRIAAALPEHDHYVEPFAGSLAVLLAKQPSRLETVNDLDQDLMTFWRVLREQPDELARLAFLTPHARAEHVACREISAAATDMERARRVWVLLSQGRMGTLRTSGWRFYLDPAGTTTPVPGYLQGYVERIPPAAWRLRHVSLECRPALEVITEYGSKSGSCIYVDPPYLRSTRASVGYRHEMDGEKDHRELAEALHACAGAVVLSGYHSPLYDDLYRDWDVLTFASRTGQGTGDGRRTEVLWSNRPFAREDTLFGETA